MLNANTADIVVAVVIHLDKERGIDLQNVLLHPKQRLRTVTPHCVIGSSRGSCK